MIPSAGNGIVERTPKHCRQFITERRSAVSQINRNAARRLEEKGTWLLPSTFVANEFLRRLTATYLASIRYFVANRLFHKLIVLFGYRLCNFPLRF